jgi:SOS-response transcriptional repressor LexA
MTNNPTSGCFVRGNTTSCVLFSLFCQELSRVKYVDNLLTTVYFLSTITISNKKNMHAIQQKILNLADSYDLSTLTLRKIGDLIDEPGSPQKIKHHLDQLIKKGLLKVDKKNEGIVKVKSGVNNGGKIYTLPIMGNANCGQAVCFADNQVEGYLTVTKHILGDYADKVNDLFVVKAIGDSMNDCNINGEIIEDGDYIIIDKQYLKPQNGDYVLSVINDVANIKKILMDKKNLQYILISQSSHSYPPIYIHQDDMDQYFVAGKVVRVMKNPEDNWEDFMNTAGQDTLNALGPIPKEEQDYYNNL